jgi:hypothetical protein
LGFNDINAVTIPAKPRFLNRASMAIKGFYLLITSGYSFITFEVKVWPLENSILRK